MAEVVPDTPQYAAVLDKDGPHFQHFSDDDIAVMRMLDNTAPWGLLRVDVIVTAMRSLQQDPAMSIGDALHHAQSDYDI